MLNDVAECCSTHSGESVLLSQFYARSGSLNRIIEQPKGISRNRESETA
jgi:hypothetical protein